MRVVFGAGDDARLVVSGEPHRLRSVELGILKCRQTQKAVPQGRMESILSDVDLIAEHEFNRLRQFGGNRGIPTARTMLPSAQVLLPR